MINNLMGFTSKKFDVEKFSVPLLSLTEKLAFPAASGARLKVKRCPPRGSSGSMALTVSILWNKKQNDEEYKLDTYATNNSNKTLVCCFRRWMNFHFLLLVVDDETICLKNNKKQNLWEHLEGISSISRRLLVFQDGVIKTKADVQERFQNLP